MSIIPKCISPFGPARLLFLLLFFHCYSYYYFFMGVRELWVRLSCSPEPCDAGVDAEAGVEDSPAM